MNEESDVRAREVEIENVRAVGVADLREVASHTVVQEPEGTTHQLEFTAGGIAAIRYADTGALVSVSAEGCGVTWTPDGILLLRSCST
jgi:hypothetical protein